MFSDSSIDPGTIQAYLETEYHVRGRTPAILKVGTVCPELLALHSANQAECSAFKTACNPFSQAFDATINAKRQRTLLGALKHQDLAVDDSIGQHPSNQ